MIDYKYLLISGGELVTRLTDVESVSFGYKRNDFVKGSISLNANKIDTALLPFLKNGNIIEIQRKGEGDSDFRLVYCGEIQKPVKSIDNKDIKTLNLTIVPLPLVYLKKRYITKTFTSTNEEDIAWGIIDELQTNTQGGLYTLDQIDMGFRLRELEATGNNRTKTYTKMEGLKALQYLANLKDLGASQFVRGFRISPDLIDSQKNRFSYFGSSYSVNRNIILTKQYIKSITEVDVDFSEFATSVTANGGAGTTPQTATTTNSSLLDTYGVREKFISRLSVTDDTELLAEAEQELLTMENLANNYEVELVANNEFTGLFRAGDIITINYQDSENFININADFRVFEISLSFDKSGKETIKIKIAKERPINNYIEPVDKFLGNLSDNDDRLTELEK